MEQFEPRLAFEHLDKLAYELGPRVAGTRGEREAASYISERLRGWGYRVRVQRFSFVSEELKRRAEALVLLGTLPSLLLPPQGMLVWIVSALLLLKLLPLFLPRARSQNVVARLGQAKPRVILTAHYDSASSPPSPRLKLFLGLAFPLALLALVACALARIFGLLPWPLPALGLLALLVSAAGAELTSALSRKPSPGANDNASGVAVMLEVARVARGLRSPNLAAIALGAEEQGLEGSKRLASLARGALVLNLDTIGVGRFCFVEGNGVLRRLRTSPQANQVLAAACERAGVKLKPWWPLLVSHDHLPLLKAGAKATTLTADSPSKPGVLAKLLGLKHARPRRYKCLHTPEDLPDRVSLRNMELAGKIALEFVRLGLGE